MTHYAKIGTLIFRAIASLLFLYGLAISILLAKIGAGVGSAALLVPGVISLVLAIVLFLASPLLGRAIAIGLGDSDRTAEPDR